MQKHYLISSLITKSNDVNPQHINNTPEPNKKVYHAEGIYARAAQKSLLLKDYDSVRKIVLDDKKPNNLIKKL